MYSPKNRPEEDAALLSAPGTPNAFSTAIKPPTRGIGHEEASGHSSLHEIKDVLSLDLSLLKSANLTGHMSLDSAQSQDEELINEPAHVKSQDMNLEAIKREMLMSLNDTSNSDSLGILDLDAMQESSSFLNSPMVSEGLRLYLSETTSMAPSSQISPAPLIKPISHQIGVAHSSPHGASIKAVYQSPNDPGDLYDMSVEDESQDIESEIALSEGDIENLNVTITEDESQSSESAEVSVASEEVGQQFEEEYSHGSTQSNLDALLNMAPSHNLSTEHLINSQLKTSLVNHSERSSLGSIQTSLPSSLTDLAKALGTSQSDNTLHFKESNDVRGSASLGPYNPFDSADLGNGGLGEFEVDENNTLSFQDQLDKDEQEIKRTVLTPSDSQLKSFRSSNPGSFIREDNVSISSYFRSKSDGIGRLSAVKLPPDKRPYFNDSTSHVIQSPPSVMDALTSTPVHPPIANPAHPPIADLVHPPIADPAHPPIADPAHPPIADPAHPPIADLAHPPIVDQEDSLVSYSATIPSDCNKSLSEVFNGLTPVITSTSCLSAPVHIPRLNLTDISSDQNYGLFCNSDSGLPSMYLKSEGTTLNSTLSRGSDTGLPSAHFKTDTSTLIFSDLSTISSLPSHLDPSDHIATHPSAYLPVGFNVTEVSTVYEPTPLCLSLDESAPRTSDVLVSGSISVSIESQATPSNTPTMSHSFAPTLDSCRSTADHVSPLNSASSPLTSLSQPSTLNTSIPTEANSVATPSTTSSQRATPSTSRVVQNQSSIVTIPSKGSGQSDPQLITSREKLAQLQTVLDASQFDVDAFLSTLNGHSLTTPTMSVTKQPSTMHSLTTPTPKFLPHDLSNSGFQGSSSSSSFLPSAKRITPPSSPRHSISPVVTPPLGRTSSLSLSPRSPSVTPPTSPSNNVSSSPSESSHLTSAETAVSTSPRFKVQAHVHPGWLQVVESLQFSCVTCVGNTSSTALSVHNTGDRWLKVTFELSHMYRDGMEVSPDPDPNPDAVFRVPHSVFIGPGHTEQVKVSFAPSHEGCFNVSLSLFACLVISNDCPSTPLATVYIKASSELPKLEVTTSLSQEETGHPTLEYGALVGGTIVSLPVAVTNHGRSTLPLKIVVNLSDPLNRMYFTLMDIPTEAHPSPSSYSQSHSLLLPPSLSDHGHQSSSLQLQLSAPKLPRQEDTSSPLELRGSLDVLVDRPHSSAVPVASIPIHALVGSARLLAPGSFKSNDYSLCCVVGQVKCGRVPLKNSGNISLRLRVKVESSHSSLFVASPTLLQLSPGEESCVAVTFAPTSQPLTSEATLMIHVEPGGPDYNVKLRGVALQPLSESMPHVSSAADGPAPPIVSPRALTLPDTVVGGQSEGVLDIHNPFSSTLQWTLTPVAPPFLKMLPGNSTCNEMFKANYPVFQVVADSQSISPHTADKVTVLFLPQDEGVFSQIWDAQVSCRSAEDQKIRLSFEGKALRIRSPTRRELQHMPPASSDPRLTKQVSDWLSQVSHGAPVRPLHTSHHSTSPGSLLTPPHHTPSSGAHHTPSSGARHTPSSGARHTPSSGARHTPSSGARHTPSSGAHHTPSSGAHHTTSSGAHHTPSSGARHTPSSGAHHTPSSGAHHTPSSGAHHTPSSGAHHTTSSGAHHTPSSGAHHKHRHTAEHSPSTCTSRMSPSTKPAVYIRGEEVLFPPTDPGTIATIKIQVCNRDVPHCKFTVIKMGSPFSVHHWNFNLGAHQCARLPVHFTPVAPGRYEGILAIKTNLKHQMFAILKGECPNL